MIARLWYDGTAHEALQLAMIGCLPDPWLVIETTTDGGRTWRDHTLEDFVSDHPEIINATRRTNRRRGRMMEWIFTLDLQSVPTQSRKDPDTMDINRLYPSRYLKPEDLRGRAVRVTISQVKIEELHNPRSNEKTKKAVLHFAGKEKVLPLNKTQAFALAEITGIADTDGWPGFVVVLAAARAHNGQPTIAITAPAQPQEPEPVINEAARDFHAENNADPAEDDEDDYQTDPVTAGDYR